LGGSQFEANPGKMFERLPSELMAGYGGACLSSPATQGSRSRRLENGGPGIKQDPVPKITKENKRGSGRMSV
jgi:hypothetical protein